MVTAAEAVLVLQLTLIVYIIAICFSGCSNDKTKEIASDKPVLKTVSDVFEKDFENCKQQNYQNLDFAKCNARRPALGHCAALEFNLSAEQKKSGKELYEAFETYCKFYFEDFDSSYVLFSPSNSNEELQEQERASYSEKKNDKKYAWYPQYETNKAQIENGTIQVFSFLYRNIEKNEYLWWVVDGGAFPGRMNKGEAYASFQTKETKISSWMPVDIPKKEKSIFNDGTHGEESYSLSGEQVSVSEAVTFFETEYLNSLPYEVEDGCSLSVSNIDVVKLDNNEYAYVFSYVVTWRTIPFDGSDDMYTNIDVSKYFTSSGEAVMTKRNDIDVIIGLSFPTVTETNKIENIISLSEAVSILNAKLTHGVKFEMQTIEFVYQGKYNEDYTKAELIPVWKFTAYNPNNNLYYCLYVDACNGEFNSYSYTLMRE